jgi:hypothetical protein
MALMRTARRLEQEAIRHCVFAIFGWEGNLPENALLNRDVLEAVVRHYTVVLDRLGLAGELEDPDLRRLAEFLAEPSVETFGSMVDAIPAMGRTFRQPPGRKAPSPDERAAEPRDRGYDGPWDPDSVTAVARQVLEFIRRHRFRSAAIMMSRCGGYTHARIARECGIPQTRSWLYEKWFEGLSGCQRRGIIAIGCAAYRGRDARQDHAVPGNTKPRLWETFMRAIAAVDAIDRIESRLWELKESEDVVDEADELE